MSEDQAPGGRTRIALLLLYLLLLLVGIALLSLGVIHFIDTDDPALLGLGVLAIVIPVAAYPIVSVLSRVPEPVPALDVALLQSINDRLLISDHAKQIAYRERDREALRQAIQDDIRKGDLEAAIVLCDEMARTYGYREEAEDFRSRIIAARAADVAQKIQSGIEAMERLLYAHDWEAAHQQALKVQRTYPDSPSTRDLTLRVKTARENHKRELEREFLQAAGRDDVERAMALLKQLDVYLTEEEAAPLREAARGVITKKRDNLGGDPAGLLVHEFPLGVSLTSGGLVLGPPPVQEFHQAAAGRPDRRGVEIVGDASEGAVVDAILDPPERIDQASGCHRVLLHRETVAHRFKAQTFNVVELKDLPVGFGKLRQSGRDLPSSDPPA